MFYCAKVRVFQNEDLYSSARKPLAIFCLTEVKKTVFIYDGFAYTKAFNRDDAERK